MTRSNDKLVAALALMAAAVIVVVISLSGGSTATHYVYLDVKEADSIVPGQWVKAAGQVVGTVSSVTTLDKGRAARIRVSVDNDVWPLHAGTSAILRWGGTVSFLNRYVALTPGPATAATLPDGTTLPTRAVKIPVEFDQVFAAFDPSTRAHLKQLLDESGTTLAASKPGLRASLQTAPQALDSTSTALADIDSSETALSTLIGSTSDVAAALETSNASLQRLITDTATTLAATGHQANALEGTLSALPATLSVTRQISGKATRTLSAADRLLTRLAPGITELRRIPTPLNSLLTSLVSVAPAATDSLNAVADRGPAITQLVQRATSTLPLVSNVSRQLNTSLDCIRPYTPEIAAFFSNWGDFISEVDGKDHVIRANIQAILPAPTTDQPYNSQDAVKLFPGLRYAFPRPPGYNADQSWFLPKCNITAASLNPALDPEAKPFPALDDFPSGGSQ